MARDHDAATGDIVRSVAGGGARKGNPMGLRQVHRSVGALAGEPLAWGLALFEHKNGASRIRGGENGRSKHPTQSSRGPTTQEFAVTERRVLLGRGLSRRSRHHRGREGQPAKGCRREAVGEPRTLPVRGASGNVE